MPNMTSAEASAANISERFGLIGNLISENFQATWSAEPIGNRHRPAYLNWATTEGATYCHADMSPVRLRNRTAQRTDSGLYYVYTADQPSLIRLDDGTELRLRPSEFFILDANTPLEWSFSSDYTTQSLLIEKKFFHAHVSREGGLVGRRLKFASGGEDCLSDMFNVAWGMTRAGVFDKAGANLVLAFLDLLSAIPAAQGGGARARENSLEARRAQIKAFIDKNYSSPDLSVGSIARHLRVSARYVQMAFASGDMTPSDYIRDRRLTACAGLLADPAWAGSTITHIALASGFNSSAYFSTEFRRVYGMSPRRYRDNHRQRS